MISLEAQSLVRALLCREVDKRMLLPTDYHLSPAGASASNGASSAPSSPSPSSAASSSSPPYLHTHPFFSDMDFTSLFHSPAPSSNSNGAAASTSGTLVVSPHVLPPYVPPKPKDIYDTINFDTDFTRLSAHLSIESEDGEAGSSSNGTSGSGKQKDERAKSRDARVSAFICIYIYLIMFLNYRLSTATCVCSRCVKLLSDFLSPLSRLQHRRARHRVKTSGLHLSTSSCMCVCVLVVCLSLCFVLSRQLCVISMYMLDFILLRLVVDRSR